MSRELKDRASAAVMVAAVCIAIALAFAIACILAARSWPVLRSHSLGQLLLSSEWRPSQGEFGFYAYIVGTLAVTALAMAISVPICLLAAVYLSEYAGERLRNAAKPFIDLLAGIPSVVYGLWGVLTVVPFVSRLGDRVGAPNTGYTVLAGAVVLAIMVFPFIISVSVEALRAVPQAAREASLAVGATRWQTVKHVVVRSTIPGIAAAVVLGFSRAFGETMALIMVVGCVAQIPGSVFDPAYPLPALIANNYGEMMTIPLYDAAIMLAALLLLIVVVAFNLLATFVLRRVERRLA